MALELRLTDEQGNEYTITGVRHPEWDGMSEPCPDCGTQEFRHFTTEGGRYGLVSGTVTLRTDYWDATKSLFTQCLGCKTILYKHPAFDLLFMAPESDGEVPLDFD